MELYTALIETQRATLQQLEGGPDSERPAPEPLHRRSITLAVRRRIGAGLHAIARAIEPAGTRAATGHST
jgi:hypothetical protein